MYTKVEHSLGIMEIFLFLNIQIQRGNSHFFQHHADETAVVGGVLGSCFSIAIVIMSILIGILVSDYCTCTCKSGKF